MYYLNTENLLQIGIPWEDTIKVIENTVKCIHENDFSQPIKPYLRYKNPINRIIAMPAYVGADINVAGIKWIASFPENVALNLPRAHSVLVLNNADTGEPICIINSSLLSVIRTASVSGLIIKYFDLFRNKKDLKVGIIGWGPIGQHHYKLCSELLADKISQFHLYDNRSIIDKEQIGSDQRVVVVERWEDAYLDADIFITCTVSKDRYIDAKPKEGSLHLNISLRDYKTNIFDYVKNNIIVDDWNEVCRENTDIELMHKEKGLLEEHTKSIVDVVCNNALSEYHSSDTLMFNPMGMAAFDIAIANYFFHQAQSAGIGSQL